MTKRLSITNALRTAAFNFTTIYSVGGNPRQYAFNAWSPEMRAWIVGQWSLPYAAARRRRRAAVIAAAARALTGEPHYLGDDFIDAIESGDSDVEILRAELERDA